jgi:ELP3 family radical SAM enzyme/protein acetyltransferase
MSELIELLESNEFKLGFGVKDETWSFNSFIPTALTKLKDKNTDNIRSMINSMIGSGEYNKITHARRLNATNKIVYLYSNIELFCEYVKMVKLENTKRDVLLEQSLRLKSIRSASGVLVFTVLMSATPHGQNFTCAYNCSFCPNEPGTARSYLRDEPAVRRGFTLNWDITLQIRNRFRSYMTTGNISLFEKEITKCDIVTEGGTFTSYPISYRRECMRDIYYACNTIYDDFETLRDPLTLEEEMVINETILGLRVIGLSIETRPDTVTHALCRELREYGVTKVQLGVQSVFDTVLKLNNRRCRYIHAQRASRILANSAFKIQIHLMPDLYGSNMEMDKSMFEQVFSDHELIFDHLKVYPCMVLEHTDLKKWYDEGLYHPYGGDKSKLLEVCISMTNSLKTYERYDVRIERVIRDFTVESIKGGCSDMNLGAELTFECDRVGIKCICVRCREVGRIKGNRDYNQELVVTRRVTRGGDEYFISYESEDRNIIFGLLRLRLPNSSEQNSESTRFDELVDSALIREVHVYNIAVPVGAKCANYGQHVGIGGKLVNEAIAISRSAGYNKISVISGVGVKGYYRNKHGFVDDGLYMSKTI